MPKKTHFDILANQLKALADPNRVRIIALLLQGEQTATDLNKQVRICQPTLSHHMKVLCDIGLVTLRKEGVRRFYCLHTQNFRALGRHLLAIADYSEGCQQAKEQGLPLPSLPEFDQIFAQANNQQAN